MAKGQANCPRIVNAVELSPCSLLNMTHPLAQNIGRTFLKEYAAEFGDFRFFAVDTFNEMRPVQSETSYLQSYSTAVREMLGEGAHICRTSTQNGEGVKGYNLKIADKQYRNCQ